MVSSPTILGGNKCFERTCTGLNVGRERTGGVSAGITPGIVGSGQENTMRDQEKACWQVGGQAGGRDGMPPLQSPHRGGGQHSSGGVVRV